MNAVAKIHPHLKDIEAPSLIRTLPGWLVWRYEHIDGEAKARKIPYYTNGQRRHGVQGRPEDRQQLTTFDAAKAAAARKGFDGVGFALMPEWGVVALDFDNCMSDGGVRPDVERLVAGTYAEYSPSGEGVRAFMRGDVGNNKAHGEPYGFETFSSKGFVTFTGNHLDVTELLGAEDTITEVSEDVRTLCAARFGRTNQVDDDPLMTYEPRANLTEVQIREALDVLDPDCGHDEWLHVGMALHHETEGQGFDLWNEWSKRGAKYPNERTLKKRWESFGQLSGRPVTARTLIKLAQANGAHIGSTVSLAEFDVIASDEPTTEGKPLKFPPVPAGEFSRGAPPSWIIKDILPKAELVVLFGESGSGKSFLALDLAGAIARGVDWRNHRTRQGAVVYIAAEGGGGFRKRLTAYANHYEVKLDDLPISIIHAAPNFLQKDDAIEVARSVKAVGQVDVVIVDTFAQVTPGANENAAEDMGKALAHCRGIHKATGAVVILVHHAGKDPTRGARGWSGLRAAADAEIEVQRLPAGRLLRISKQKDGEDGKEWGFDLHMVPVGMDEDGDIIESCVVVEAELPVGRIGELRRKLGPWERLAIDVVAEIAKSQNSGIELDAVIDEMVRQGPPAEDGKRDTRKQRARRAVLALANGDDAPFFFDDGCLSVV